MYLPLHSPDPPCRFLGTLKQHTIQGSVPGDEDLNVEHLQLLLLLFHNLSEGGRHMVLTLVAQAIAEVAQSGETQLKAVPLNLARLLLVLDYMLHHYSKTPVYLFEQVGEAEGPRLDTLVEGWLDLVRVSGSVVLQVKLQQ